MVKPTDNTTENMRLLNRVSPSQEKQVQQSQHVDKVKEDQLNHQGSQFVKRRMSFTPIHDVYGRDGQVQGTQNQHITKSAEEQNSTDVHQARQSQLRVISQADAQTTNHVLSMEKKIADLESQQSVPELLLQKSSYSHALQVNESTDSAISDLVLDL